MARLSVYLSSFLLTLASEGLAGCTKDMGSVVRYDNNTRRLMAPGFVETLTIPKNVNITWDPDFIPPELALRTREVASAVITRYPGVAGAPRSSFKIKSLHDEENSVNMNVTGHNWGVTEWRDRNNGTWAGFEAYFANGGPGIVIDVQNNSTLTINDDGGFPHTAQPSIFKKIAVAFDVDTEIEITLSQANKVEISMKAQKLTLDPYLNVYAGGVHFVMEHVDEFLFDNDFLFDEDNKDYSMDFGLREHGGHTINHKCADFKVTFDSRTPTSTPTQAKKVPTPKPTPEPTPASGTLALGTTMISLCLGLAAAMALVL